MVGVVKVEKRWGKTPKPGKVDVEEVLRTEVGNGIVYIYRIEVDEYHSVRSFYVATYGSKDEPNKIWGLGESPEEALKDAMKNWDKEELTKVKEGETERYFNPFLKAYRPLKEKVREEVKGVLELVVDEGETITEEDLENGELLDDEVKYLRGRTVGILDVELVLNTSTVTVYHMSVPVNGNGLNLPAYFYIVTLDVDSVEKVWGLGETVKGALEDAVKRWDDVTGGYANPFRKVLKVVEEEG